MDYFKNLEIKCQQTNNDGYYYFMTYTMLKLFHF